VLGLPGNNLQSQVAIFARTRYYLTLRIIMGSTENLWVIMNWTLYAKYVSLAFILESIHCCYIIFSKYHHLECRNKQEDFICDRWKGLGYCRETYVSYLETKCQKACGYCDGKFAELIYLDE
jgi:hypothetical protein